jgi:hypothetical protein
MTEIRYMKLVLQVAFQSTSINKCAKQETNSELGWDKKRIRSGTNLILTETET